jgi:hypothetical protein
MNDTSPGLNPKRLLRLMRDAIERCHLELSGKVVLTEAATGAYVVTPVLAAMAGAEKVYAITKDTRHGTVQQVQEQTEDLARIAGVGARIEMITQKQHEVVAQADIITNSGHVRPIDAEMVSWMKPSAVVPLMYEAWEFRPGDIDLAACRRHGIKVAGTNECHPAVDVFSFLGTMAVKLLLDAGITSYGTSILCLCDNPFGPFIEEGLTRAGARVQIYQSLSRVEERGLYDAVVVALRPKREPVLSADDVITIGNRWPGAVVAQFWGDVDRKFPLGVRVPIWPPQAPAPGHMAILPSDIGPEPIVRLQSGGLKVAELLVSGDSKTKRRDSEFLRAVEMEDLNG